MSLLPAFVHDGLTSPLPSQTLLHENGAKYVSEYVGLEYNQDLMLDAAVDSILGDGECRRVRTYDRLVAKALFL